MTTAQIQQLVQDARGRGPLARLAACELARVFRTRLGYAPIRA